MRFAILKNNRYVSLDLSANAQVSYNTVVSIFDVEATQKEYTFPIRAEWTTHNKTVLDFAYRFDAKPTTYVARLELTQRAISGEARIVSDNGTSFEIAFTAINSTTLARLEKTMLSEVVENIIIPQSVTAYWLFEHIEEVQLFLLHLNDVLYDASHVFAMRGTESDAVFALADMINDPTAAQGFGSGLNARAYFDENANRMRIEIRTLSDTQTLKVNAMLGFTLVSYRTNSDAKQQNFASWFMANRNHAAVRFPYLYAPNAFPNNMSWNYYYSSAIFNRTNLVSNIDTFLLNEYTDKEGQFRSACVPFVRVGYLLSRIALHTNIAIVIDASDIEIAAINATLLPLSTALISESKEYASNSANIEKYLMWHCKEIPLRDIVPNASAKALLIAVCQCYALCFAYDIVSNTLYLRKRSDIFTKQVNISAILTTQYKIAHSENKGYTFAFARDNTEPLAATLSKITVGAGENLHTLSFFTLANTTHYITRPNRTTILTAHAQFGTLASKKNTPLAFVSAHESDNQLAEPLALDTLHTRYLATNSNMNLLKLQYDGDTVTLQALCNVQSESLNTLLAYASAQGCVVRIETAQGNAQGVLKAIQYAEKVGGSDFVNVTIEMII